MTSTPSISTLSLAVIGLLAALPAAAQDGGYTYLGLKVGQAHGSFGVDHVSASLLSPTVSATTTSRDDHDTAYGAFAGYQINRYLGVEAGFFSLGRFAYTASTVPAGSLTGQIRAQGASFDLVGTLPMGERLSALGRIGASYARSLGTFVGTGAAGSVTTDTSERKVNPEFGLGLQYEFSPAFLLRAEAERQRINDAAGSHGNVNVYSVSMVFPFGRSPTLAPRAMAATAYSQAAAPTAPMRTAAAPAPAPMLAAAPPATRPIDSTRRRVSFSAESLFGFDKSALRPDGISALNTFVGELQGSQFEQIIVEGHTDRLGTVEYNQKLSEQRAESVKAYLVSTGKLDANKISAVGKSESAPVTKAADCPGRHATAKLIACLQPDRRVDVEVTGTR